MPYNARNKIIASLEKGPKTWAGLLESTGLSKAAVSTNLKVLIQELVVTAEVDTSTKRPSTVYKIEKAFLVFKEHLNQFLTGTVTQKVDFQEAGKMALESKKRVWMVANCIKSAHSTLFKMFSLPPESNLYVGVFKQEDGKLLLTIKQPSDEDQRRLKI
jgi:predicted transcriptional regulator